MRMRADSAGADRSAHDRDAQRARRDAAIARTLPVRLDGDGEGKGSGGAPCGPLLGCLQLDRRPVDPAVRGVVRFAAVGESFALLEEAARLREPDGRAVRNRVPLPGGLPQDREPAPLRGVVEVDVRTGDQIPRVIDVVPVREVLDAARAGLPAAFRFAQEPRLISRARPARGARRPAPPAVIRTTLRPVPAPSAPHRRCG